MLPLRVLIIEDSESDAALLLRQLRKAEYAVSFERVENSDQMKTALAKQAWDIIIADYQLPEFDAPSALSLLQESQLDIPFIVVSGAIGEETAAALMRSGARDYLMKGSLARLAPLVKRELVEAKLRQEQKKSQDLLALQSAALNAAANAIVIADHEGTIQWVNPAFTTLTGYTFAEAAGKNMHQLVYSETHDQAFYKHMWDAILAGDVWQGEMTNRRKDGRIYIEEQTITPLRDASGQIGQFIAIKQDITQRKQMETDLRLWADAFKYCAHGIALFDPHIDRLMICNPAFARLHGSTVEDLIGINPPEMFASEFQEYVQQKIETADLFGQVQFEAPRLRKDGSTFPAQMDLASVRDVNGSLLYRVASVEDISQRKQAGSDLLKQMEESRQRAHELEIITELSASMRQVQTQTELFKVILHKLVELLKVNAAAFAVLEKSGELVFEGLLGENQLWQKYPASSDWGIFGEVALSGNVITAGGLDPQPKIVLPDWADLLFVSPASLIIYPLKNRQIPIGLIALAFNHPTVFLPEQLNLVASVAEMAGSALNRMSQTAELESMVSRREQELEYIYQITSAASKTSDMRLALQEALAVTFKAVHAQMGGIYLLNETDGRPELVVSQGTAHAIPEIIRHTTLDNFLGQVVQNKKAVVIPDLMADPKVLWNPDPDVKNSFIGTPMLNQGRVVGILGVVKEAKNQVNVEEMTLLSFIADHLALVVENTRLYKKAQLSAVMDERSRLARELHDSVTQSMFSANLYISGAQKYAAQGDHAKVDAYLEQIGQLILQSLRDMRLLVYELRNPALFENGLAGALENRLDSVERRSGIQVDLQADGIPRLPEPIEENLYRIAIEALNNSLKHARASHLWVKLIKKDNQLQLTIQDDGRGFDPASEDGHGGMGMTTMHERSRIMAGDFQFHSSPGNGTCIEIKVPLVDNQGPKIGGND